MLTHSLIYGVSGFQTKKRSVLFSFFRAAAATSAHRICPASSVRSIMLPFAILTWIFVSAVSAESTNSFHKGKSTEKPDVLHEGSPIPKSRKPPTHISEFTDPNTGLNPFLDLEEGPTSAGRNVMKDERRKDPPFFDFELVEGDAPERRWGLEMPKEPIEEPIQRWPSLEDNIKIPSTTTFQYEDTELPSTTKESFMKVSLPEKSYNEKRNEEHKIIKEISTSSISTNSLIYASATVVAVVALALLVGVCWWRRKLKRTSQSHIAVENGELKS